MNTFTLSISPNPFTDNININAGSETYSNVIITVINMLGERVNRFSIYNTNDLTINLDHLTSGSYILLFESDFEIKYYTLIKN